MAENVQLIPADLEYTEVRHDWILPFPIRQENFMTHIIG